MKLSPFYPRHCAHLVVAIMFLSAHALAAATNIVVQISADGAETIPPETIATPAQVAAVDAAAAAALDAAAAAAAAAAESAAAVTLYSTNYVVTSTVYVQSIGGVPFDPSNQTVTVQSIATTPTNLAIIATVRQIPLVPPVLDWRAALAAGAWTNIPATVAETTIPPGVTNAAKAYRFTLARPDGGSSFFRVVDNSSGASGSGLWWLVYGGIWVDGHEGFSGTVTNDTEELKFVGGILVEPDPLGE